jgi:DNA-binding transcriptional regulator YiaG
MTGMSIDELVAEVRQRHAFPEPAVRKAIREAVGIPRTRIASALGVTPTTVWRWETGEREPRGDLRARYGELLMRLQEVAE